MESMSRTQFVCRRVGPTALNELMALEASCFKRFDVNSKESLRRSLRSSSIFCFAVFHRKKMIGYTMVHFRTNAFVGHIDALGVHPNFRKRGVAKQLLVRAENTAISFGYTRLRLEVRLDNSSAQSLYYGMGYDDYGIELRYYEDGAHALRMRKDLKKT